MISLKDCPIYGRRLTKETVKFGPEHGVVNAYYICEDHGIQFILIQLGTSFSAAYQRINEDIEE
jgi:hypothetical protein